MQRKSAPGESGRFFDDYNRQRIPPFEKVIRESDAAAVAADLMSSQTVQLFHDHVLVKEPGTAKPTPWHQDALFCWWAADGQFLVSVDPVDDATLRCVAGSHLWDRPVLPTVGARIISTPMKVTGCRCHPDAGRVLEWPAAPGMERSDFRVLHGARGNKPPAPFRCGLLVMTRVCHTPGPHLAARDMV